MAAGGDSSNINNGDVSCVAYTLLYRGDIVVSASANAF